jgi:hypothetical protein
MGLYDTIRCRYPLPHHQDAEFQTKDIECLLEGNSGMGGSLSEYEITEEGGVRLHVHEREWHDDPNAFLGGYAKSVRDWWEDVPDLHGDIRIYTNDEDHRLGRVPSPLSPTESSRTWWRSKRDR